MHLLYGELTSEEVKNAVEEGYVLVLPVGAIEQHGPHLPVEVDDYLATRWALDGVEEAVEKYKAKVLMLPPIHYGNSMRHMNFPGAIYLSFETLIAVVFEVLDCVVRQGFRRIVIVNGNGGNDTAVSIAAHKITEKGKREGKDVKVWIVDGGAKALFSKEAWDKVNKLIKGNEGEIHGGAVETSEYLAGKEELVHRERMKKPYQSEIPCYVWTIDEITDTGATGDPTKACREAGEILWQSYKENFGKFLSGIK